MSNNTFQRFWASQLFILFVSIILLPLSLFVYYVILWCVPIDLGDLSYRIDSGIPYIQHALIENPSITMDGNSTSGCFHLSSVDLFFNLIEKRDGNTQISFDSERKDGRTYLFFIDKYFPLYRMIYYDYRITKDILKKLEMPYHKYRIRAIASWLFYYPNVQTFAELVFRLLLPLIIILEYFLFVPCISKCDHL